MEKSHQNQGKNTLIKQTSEDPVSQSPINHIKAETNRPLLGKLLLTVGAFPMKMSYKQ